MYKAEVERLIDKLTDAVRSMQSLISSPVSYPEEAHKKAREKVKQARAAILSNLAPEWQDAPDGEGEYEVVHTVEVFTMYNRLRVKFAHPYPIVNNLKSAKWRRKEG